MSSLMQYTQRKSQRSVTDSRAYVTWRSKRSTSGVIVFSVVVTLSRSPLPGRAPARCALHATRPYGG